MLYEVLTLQHAFEAGSMRQLVQRIIAGRYAPVSQRYSRRAAVACMHAC